MEEEVCRKLEKLKSIVKVEYQPIELDKYDYYSERYDGVYTLHMSNHIRQIANKYKTSWSDISLLRRIQTNVELIMNTYYDSDDNYQIDLRNDYNGEWLIRIFRKR